MDGLLHHCGPVVRQNLSVQERVAEQNCSAHCMVARKQRETEEGTWDSDSKNVPLSHLFSLNRAPPPAVFAI